MKVLVTGGAGFIGQHVCRALTTRDHEPIVFDRAARPQTFFESYFGDIRDPTAVTEAVAHVDAVIHLAGVLGTQETIGNPYPATKTNVLGGLNVLQAVAQYQLPAVYIAVGNHWMDNTYSISKTTVERFVRMFNQERDTDIRIVRALNAYGPGQSLPAPYGPSKVRKIIPSFVGAALHDQPIEIYGDGNQIMDMIYVEDVAEILIDALLTDINSAPADFTYSAGTGRPTTVTQIALAVLAACGGGDITHAPMRPGEPEHSRVIGKPETLKPLGWDTARMVPLEVGIPKTVEYFKTVV